MAGRILQSKANADAPYIMSCYVAGNCVKFEVGRLKQIFFFGGLAKIMCCKIPLFWQLYDLFILCKYMLNCKQTPPVF